MPTIRPTAALALGLLLAAASGAPASAQDGEALFRKQCATCHAVPAAGIEAKVKKGPMAGPALPAAIAGADEGALGAFLRQEAELEGEEHPKAFEISDAETAALLAWLTSLSGQGS